MTFAEQEFRGRRRANPLKAPAAPVREAEPAQAGDPRALTADEMDDAALYFKGFKPEKMRFVADRFQIRSHDGRVLLDSDEAPRTPIESDPSGLPLGAPGAKADKDKVLAGELIMSFPHAMDALCQVATFGAKKYSRAGFLRVENGEVRYLDAAMRHLIKHGKGEALDSETGLPHLWAVLWNVAAIVEIQERSNGKDAG